LNEKKKEIYGYMPHSFGGIVGQFYNFCLQFSIHAIIFKCVCKRTY